MWTEGKDWPWENASDCAIPDMATASMKMQDTLNNAVMSQRPPVMAKATKKIDKEKEESVNRLLDYQLFVEQPGEEAIGTLAHDFVNEGFWTAYVPWVKETRSVIDVKVIPPIPDEIQPIEYFRMFLEGTYPHAQIKPTRDGWDWVVNDGDKKHKASFFTREDNEVEVNIEKDAIRYEGPRVIPKDVQDVLHPVRCENLQIPGPSNPLGASHVILRDFPSIDEIKRLQDSGYYDLMDQKDADKIMDTLMDVSYTEREQQKDTMQGAVDWRQLPKGAESQNKLTRLMVFDTFDINDDGLDEDVIFWMILETKTILRARYLTQMFPAEIPFRPLAEAHLFPVPGRRFSIGILELMEGLHDIQKQTFDQTSDAGTISNSPFFFYRATSNMRPEVIRLWPGEGYPVSDPKNDVSFPQIGNPNQSFGLNFLAIINQMEEKLTNIGDLQLGRVPHGKASALRTVSGMQTVMAQGDARPERVLRRFFMGLTQIWKIAHTLNQAFLPDKKQFLIIGLDDPTADPYGEITKRDQVAGAFMFDFSANALNTSKEAMQSSLQSLMSIYVSQLNLQLGIIDAAGAYRMQRDLGKAYGQDPDKYIKPPTPGAETPKVFYEEAMTSLLNGQMPTGEPAEGAQAHLQKLAAFVGSDEFGHLDPMHVQLFKQYLTLVQQKAAQEQQQAQLMQAVQQFQQGQPPGQQPQGAPPGPQAQAPVQGNELMDETLPTAGGGANGGPQ
jgi:hypothetical protein